MYIANSLEQSIFWQHIPRARADHWDENDCLEYFKSILYIIWLHIILFFPKSSSIYCICTSLCYIQSQVWKNLISHLSICMQFSITSFICFFSPQLLALVLRLPLSWLHLLKLSHFFERSSEDCHHTKDYHLSRHQCLNIIITHLTLSMQLGTCVTHNFSGHMHANLTFFSPDWFKHTDLQNSP